MKRHKTVEGYISSQEKWQEALKTLRKIVLFSGLVETVKWGAPIYTFKGKNIVGLGAFKSYVGLWFFQGALLKDGAIKLMNAQEGKTKAMRQWRFYSIEEIDEQLIKNYIAEAIQNQEMGREIKADRRKRLVIPEELTKALKRNPELSGQFNQLTRGKQREYAEYIDEAKREATKMSRLEKIVPLILEGKGLNDKYRKA